MGEKRRESNEATQNKETTERNKAMHMSRFVLSSFLSYPLDTLVMPSMHPLLPMHRSLFLCCYLISLSR